MHTGCKVFILVEARTHIKSCVHCIPLFFTSVSTPTLNFSHKIMTVGIHCEAHEIKLRDSNGILIDNQVPS
jgi:hypothetical protein